MRWFSDSWAKRKYEPRVCMNPVTTDSVPRMMEVVGDSEPPSEKVAPPVMADKRMMGIAMK